MTIQVATDCFETQHRENNLVVRFHGHKVRLGDNHLRVLRENLVPLINEARCDELNLDLNNIETVASTALAQFESLHQELAAEGINFRVTELSPHVYELFEAARMHEVFDIRQRPIGTAAVLSET